MSPRAVLALGLLLMVPLRARAASTEADAHHPVLERVEVREHHSPEYGRGLELTFKLLEPDPTLAWFSVEDARAFVEALETEFQVQKPRSGRPSLPGLHSLSVTTGLLSEPPPDAQEYHQRVYRRLEVSLGICRDKAECRARLIEELDRIAADICKPGSALNKLLTKNS